LNAIVETSNKFYSTFQRLKDLQTFNYTTEKEENAIYFSLNMPRIHKSASTQMTNQFYLKD